MFGLLPIEGSWFLRFEKLLKEFFRKSPRPSLLIKRAALGNLKASFHCTHWHRFFLLKRAPPLTPTLFNGLYTPFGSPVFGGQKPQGRGRKPPYSAIFAPPVFNSLYDPFGSPCRGQKPLREGPSSPFPKGQGM